MCEKTFKIKTIFFQTIQFFDWILYNILLLFRGPFISGVLRPPPKWPIASTSPDNITISMCRLHLFVEFTHYKSEAACI